MPNNLIEQHQEIMQSITEMKLLNQQRLDVKSSGKLNTEFEELLIELEEANLADSDLQEVQDLGDEFYLNPDDTRLKTMLKELKAYIVCDNHIN